MNDRNITKIILDFDNGEELVITKGFIVNFTKNKVDDTVITQFNMCGISGKDLQTVVLSVLQLGQRLGMFNE